MKGNTGKNPEGSHLYVNRWLVEGVVEGYLAVRVFCGRVLPGASPLHIAARVPLPPAGSVGPCILVMPSCVSDPSVFSASQLPGPCFQTSSLPLFYHFVFTREQEEDNL